MDPWSEEVVVEGWVGSGLVGVLAGLFEYSVVVLVVVEGEEMMGSGSLGVGAENVSSVDAMVDR